jgi:GTP-binding protein
MFIDRVQVKVKAGDGGNGCSSFRREKFVPRGGPDGGDGGHGGNVIFKVHGGETTLIGLHSRPYYEAQRGRHGEGSNKTGQQGEDLTCLVPPGTVVRDAETGELICDLTEDGQEFIVAQGGRGGRGNARFATSTRQAPRYSEPGRKGDLRLLKVEHKKNCPSGAGGDSELRKIDAHHVMTPAHASSGRIPFTRFLP